jgi:hypothetical protein
VTYDIDHDAEQLETDQAKNEQHQTEEDRKNKIAAIPPGQSGQAADEFSGGIFTAGIDADRFRLHPKLLYNHCAGRRRNLSEVNSVARELASLFRPRRRPARRMHQAG